MEFGMIHSFVKVCICAYSYNTILFFKIYIERVQLTHGFKHSAGHVEIFDKYHNDYKPICDRNWNLYDANVVCNQLGYPGAIRATRRSYFIGSSTEQQLSAIFNNVDCTGLEESIFDCPDTFGMPLDTSTLNSCPSQSTAGVICNGQFFNILALLCVL